MKATRTTHTRQAASLPDYLTTRLPAYLSSFLTLSTLCFPLRTSLRTTNHEPRTLVLPLVISCRNHVVSRRFRVVFGRFWSFQVGIFTDKNLGKPHFQPNFALLPLFFDFSTSSCPEPSRRAVLLQGATANGKWKKGKSCRNITAGTSDLLFYKPLLLWYHFRFMRVISDKP
jgi:hypothetical protein